MQVYLQSSWSLCLIHGLTPIHQEFRASCRIERHPRNRLFNLEFLELIRNHNVHVVCFPAHTTHILQPTDRDLHATFDPTVAPSAAIQTDDTMPPDPSNVVEVKTTSFDDHHTAYLQLPLYQQPKKIQASKLQPYKCLTQSQGEREGENWGEFVQHLCRKAQGQIRSEERRGVDVQWSLQKVLASDMRGGKQSDWWWWIIPL